MRNILLCSLVLLALPRIVWGQREPCSLLVRVVDVRDQEVTGALIRVEEAGGRTEELRSRRGGARFCDLGIRSVTVIVGDSSCNQVTVRNVPLEWGRMSTTKVIYDLRECQRERQSAIPQCEILLRFKDPQGNWIPKVSLSSPLIGLPGGTADVYGRYLVGVPFGGEIRSTAEKEGYHSQNIRHMCHADRMFDEQVVTLQPK